jgi:hypothetical protein
MLLKFVPNPKNAAHNIIAYFIRYNLILSPHTCLQCSVPFRCTMLATFPMHLIPFYMSTAVKLMFVFYLISTAVNVQIMVVFLLHGLQTQNITPIFLC